MRFVGTLVVDVGRNAVLVCDGRELVVVAPELVDRLVATVPVCIGAEAIYNDQCEIEGDAHHDRIVDVTELTLIRKGIHFKLFPTT